MVVGETEKYRTARLVARSCRADDLPFAMELWGDPAVMALIDARGQLTPAEVEEKLRAEIERERIDGVQYWALLNGGSSAGSSDRAARSPGAADCGAGATRRTKPISNWGFTS